MPARRNIGRRTNTAASKRRSRAERTSDQIDRDNLSVREGMSQLRATQSQHNRIGRNQQRRLERAQTRRFVTNIRRTYDQQRQQEHRAFSYSSFHRIAFQYEPDIAYYNHSKVLIGSMDQECRFCHALKFKHEPAGMCCASGKVYLPSLETPPEPLKGLLTGTDSDSAMFLKSIRKFNSCFQMTSFGATEIVSNASSNGQIFNSTFKIKGQVYHKVGSLLPMPNTTPKFLQIY